MDLTDRQPAVPTWLQIFCGSRSSLGFHPHGEKRAEEQNDGAPNLRGGEPLTKKESGKPEGAGGTKKLESLGERDPDFADGDVIQRRGPG